MDSRIETWIRELSDKQKASLLSGADVWHTLGIKRLGIPSIMLTDGPHGLRKQAQGGDHLGLQASVPSTCFPTACLTACSFDDDLLREMGRAIGEECLQEEVAVVLGPGANIKRSPLCGRNFEYFSEDPYLSGRMACAWIRGVQETGVGVSLKHFAANNQETRRMTVDVVIDERALREIYLAAFEYAVRHGNPATLMCAYNRINGVFCSENPWLLNRVLRDEWGFGGLVMTDWGAANDRAKGVPAGLDLEMPSSFGLGAARILEGLKKGELTRAELDTAVRRVLRLAAAGEEARKANAGYRYDSDAHHALARRIAAESSVLLKNEEGLLPLSPDARLAVIGAFAKRPRYQGAGSSLIQPLRLDSVCSALDERGVSYSFCEGYDESSDEPDDARLAEAIAAAKCAEVALLCVGLPAPYESEGFDRRHMRLPASHIALIEAVAAAQPNAVVLYSGGGAVEMPWADRVPTILLGYLGGQAGASGAVDALYGTQGPYGRLAESLPYRLEDTPSHPYFPGGRTVEYRESVFVGYRYYESAAVKTRYPFGHGLLYTSFDYSDARLSAESICDGGEVTASVTVTNTGDRFGKETVQVYVHAPYGPAFRPERELKGFAKVALGPGESRTVSIRLDRRAFAYYNTEIEDWYAPPGEYAVQFCASAHTVLLSLPLRIESSAPEAPQPDLSASAPAYYAPDALVGVPPEQFEALLGHPIPPAVRGEKEPFDHNSTLSEIRGTRAGRRLHALVSKALKRFGGGEEDSTKRMFEAMLEDMPLRGLTMLSGGRLSLRFLDAVLRSANRQIGAR